MSTPRRPLGLNTVCFLEDLSLKKICASSSWCRCGLMSSNLFSGQAEKEFEVKVEAIRKVGHKNLLRLIGYCAKRGHRMQDACL
ncbi:putative non-specific serine/threonine protein kinase [Helianthus anomalus]